jgi:hypothetical protein
MFFQFGLQLLRLLFCLHCLRKGLRFEREFHGAFEQVFGFVPGSTALTSTSKSRVLGMRNSATTA